mmetsp:Transcript_13399/g.28754  ORF Transcript_13399/g.28754 Transcript_13399/m.28754 type:complete len:239 (+) Transcript_13399:2712-3428(+)
MGHLRSYRSQMDGRRLQTAHVRARVGPRHAGCPGNYCRSGRGRCARTLHGSWEAKTLGTDRSTSDAVGGCHYDGETSWSSSLRRHATSNVVRPRNDERGGRHHWDDETPQCPFHHRATDETDDRPREDGVMPPSWRPLHSRVTADVDRDEDSGHRHSGGETPPPPPRPLRFRATAEVVVVVVVPDESGDRRCDDGGMPPGRCPLRFRATTTTTAADAVRPSNGGSGGHPRDGETTTGG